jgi:putative restriction endonuclease
MARANIDCASDPSKEHRTESALDIDAAVRAATFAFLDHQTTVHGEVLPRGLLAEGFQFEGRRVPLIGPQGIFKPAILPDMPLSITTTPEIEGKDRPYRDEMGPDGLLRYSYRGTDPGHRDNVGVRLAMQRRAPLIYLWGVIAGRYMPVWPVFVVQDDPARLTFSVAVDDSRIFSGVDEPDMTGVAEARRAYVTTLTLRRMHQQGFSHRVLRAYREACAVCRLRHRELLEACHILPDGHPRGEPIVPNGIALCRLHHAAYDRNILGIRPDLKIVIRTDVLHEIDGPMLRHGLQGFEGCTIQVPSRAGLRPKPEFLAERFETFRHAS